MFSCEFCEISKITFFQRTPLMAASVCLLEKNELTNSLIWMFCSKKSTKRINAVHERSLQTIRNYYESLYPFSLEEAHQITLYQRCINSLMTKVYKYLNGHSPDIMNDIFKLRENMYDLRNFHIFQTENPRSLKNGLDTNPYRADQLWQQAPI